MKKILLLFSFSICLMTHINTKTQHIQKKINFILITSLYNETDKERVNEYISCLKNNLAHPNINNIHVLYDTSKDNNNTVLLDFLKHNNITIHYIQARPSFHECFELANTLFPSKTNIILSNADIYFNNSLQKINESHLENTVLALTRWNVLENESMQLEKRLSGKNNENSQDAWIFKTPLDFVQCKNIYLGTYQCDGRIAYEIKKAGFKILNPCLTIQCCHLHLSNIRNYEVIKQTENMIGVPWITI